HALVGENGAGKSTLINILSGSLQPDAGVVRMAGNITRIADAHDARRQGIVTVHQEVDLFPDLHVAENFALLRGGGGGLWVSPHRQREEARAALADLGEELPLDAPAAVLSPAQRQLLCIAAALAQQAMVLILDEPTSSLSAAESRVLFARLHQLRDKGVAVLYVSHRFEEIFALAGEITVLRDGRRG